MPARQQHILTGLLFLGLLLMVSWAFQPGLGGAFIFDDLPNLQPWSGLQDINSIDKLLAFTFSSKFFPGRPLSLMSFLIDDQSWPPSIQTLKQTNLAIHLVNVCLVFWFSIKLMQCLLPGRDHSTILLLSLGVAAIWALHPMQVSTVSYIIQRMCLLCTTLTLAALLLFMYGREQLAARHIRGIILCSISIGLLMPLAILTKESGLLICVFALLIDGLCYEKNRSPSWRLWKAIFLALPLLLFLGHCLVTYRLFTVGFDTRNFNAWERLLTQGPVLIDYLQKLLLPSLSSGGLFFDNFPVSRSLFNPPATAVAWLVIMVLVTGAWWLRQRLPLLSFGLLFFFCGHLMESTVLPLELYFEHRNYLPQLGLWLALAELASLPASRLIKLSLRAALAAWFLLLVFITHNNAMLWGDPDLQASVWYQNNPSSQRTIAVYANVLMRTGQEEKLEKVLTMGRVDYPNSLNLLLMQRVMRCYGKNLPTPFSDLPAFAQHADYDNGVLSTLEKMRKATIHVAPHTQGCVPPDNQQIAKIYEGLLANPGYQWNASAIHQYLGEMAQVDNAPDTAISHYDQAFRSSHNPIYAFRAALLREAQGDSTAAAKYVDQAEQALSWRDKIINPEFPARIRLMREKLAMPPQEALP